MIKRSFLLAAFIILASGFFFSPAFAAYSWVDENGVFHITDYPKPVKREEPKKSSPATVAPAEAPAPSAAPQVKKTGPMQTTVSSPGSTTSAAAVPSSAGTPTIRPLTPVSAGTPSSAGTLTTRPATPVSQNTPTPGGQTGITTIATVSPVTTTAALPVVPQQPHAALPASQQIPAAGMVAFVLAFFTVFLVLLAIMYVYFSLCLYLIAKKLNVPSPWVAWVPIANLWTLLQAAGKPCWWVLLFFIPFVSIIAVAYVWMCVVENLGRNKWLGLLLLIPIVNLVYLGVLAFSKEEQHDDPYGQPDDMGEQMETGSGAFRRT